MSVDERLDSASQANLHKMSKTNIAGKEYQPCKSCQRKKYKLNG